MIVVVAVLLSILSLFFIALPFFRQKGSWAASNDDEKRELHSRQDITYSMLKELEFDFQSGLVAEQDYRDLEVRYKRKAISILKDADNMEKGTEVEGDIEEQVKKLRSVKKNAVDDQKVPVAKSVTLDKELEEEIRKLRQTKGRDADRNVGEDVPKVRNGKGKFCPRCGTKSEEDDLFCSSCGAKLK